MKLIISIKAIVKMTFLVNTYGGNHHLVAFTCVFIQGESDSCQFF